VTFYGSRKYPLSYQFKGNAHVVYNGSFYYHAKSTNRIIKFSLLTGNSYNLSLPFPYSSNSTNLYTGQFNYMDFNVDDNGLWVIFPVPDSNNTAIMKVNYVNVLPTYAKYCVRDLKLCIGEKIIVIEVNLFTEDTDAFYQTKQ
jgi:hypothetical protein